MSWRRIVYITRKELLQVKRDPKMIRLMLLAPIFQLIVFGYAITSDVQHITTAILDMDNTSQSREFVRRFTSVPRYFKVVDTLSSPRPIDKLLDSGDAQMAIWIPKGFAADLGRGKQAEVQFILDASDSKAASIIGGYVNAVTAGFSRDVLTRFAASSGGSLGALPQIDARVRVWYNPDMRSVNFMVPGVICLILLIVTMMNTSLAVVREREIGTLEQLIVTPIRPIELMIGKIVPFVLMGIVDVLLIVAVAVFWFKVPIAGSMLLLLGLTIVFLSTSLGLGLLVSTVSHTQQQAMMTSFFVIQPSILLSGFMFPIDSMPRAIQIITYAIPLRYFLEIIRGIFLRGVGLEALWPQALCLLVLGSLLLWASVVRFVKKVG